MQLSSQIEKPILKKASATNLPQQLEPEIKIIEAPKPALKAKQKLEENNNKLEYDFNYYYSPVFDNLQLKSIENSGWQVSDI
ncbi:hypothetical protein H6G97_45945 [Nostoc flagelliforme FACHB-838]|uniref:Uncharacterized protein n=1 Tax=Nostoc flagelliforme FACHB-838 TaxID=2692904 RepID=A0ABR8E6I8_9NOSO|nr:hypothetical protein [Nostoc flagelliforme]MBD2536248.1 hypothetical protein [Nostoc flagelliforme FACHB-838]